MQYFKKLKTLGVKGEKLNSSNRKLIQKKFVTGNTLVVVFVITLLFIVYFLTCIINFSLYLIIIIGLPLIFLVWHKVYQVLYDLKLLFLFNDEYDAKVDCLKERSFPTVTFIVPSYQEPFFVAKMTFDSIVNIPYNGRKEVIVVDNSGDPMSEDFLNWKAYVENFYLNCQNKNMVAKFLYNDQKCTLKAGNLDLAQRSIEEGQFVVFLDVDSTLPDTGNLLERAVAEFEVDNKLGFLQFRIKATNGHFNSLTQGTAVNQDLLRLRQISRGYGGYKIFEGHNGIFRKSVLDQVESWTEYFRGNVVITEDILMSAQVYSKGYYGKPLNIQTGEWVPSSLTALESMWMRWMYGNSQVFFKCFRKIYSKQTSLIEKFDISYHILQHLVTGCFLAIAFLLQLCAPGPITNIFIISMFIVPQLIGGLTSYFVSQGKSNDLPIIRKIQHTYAAFFLIETFIMFTQIKSEIKFILRVRQGWKVTEKGVENILTWKNLIRNKSFHIGMAIFSIIVCAISWVYNYNMAAFSLGHHFGLLFITANQLLCIVVYSKQGRKSHNKIESAIISNTSLDARVKTELI